MPESQMILLSEDGGVDDVQLGREDDALVLAEEPVVKDAGQCQPGESWGKVIHVRTDIQGSDKTLVTATFVEDPEDEEDDGDTLSFKGVAKKVMHNGRPSFKGRLGVIGGTGKYVGRGGQAMVDNCNPKRWIIDLTP